MIKDHERLSATLAADGADITPCGSMVTCDPPPLNTDTDYLVVLRESAVSVSSAVGLLTSTGFHWEGSVHYQDAAATFMSWRKDDVNLIVTKNKDFARQHKLATAVCKKLNLLDKAQRITVFQALLYGVLK